MKSINEYWKNFKRILRCDPKLTYHEDTELIVEAPAAVPEAVEEVAVSKDRVRGFLDI